MLFHNLQPWTHRDYRNRRQSHINFHPQPTQSTSPHSTRNSTDLIIKIPMRGFSITFSVTSPCVCLSQESEREPRTANHRAQRICGTAQSQRPVSTDFLLWWPHLFMIHSYLQLSYWRLSYWSTVYYLAWKRRECLLHTVDTVGPGSTRQPVACFWCK